MTFKLTVFLHKHGSLFCLFIILLMSWVINNPMKDPKLKFLDVHGAEHPVTQLFTLISSLPTSLTDPLPPAER